MAETSNQTQFSLKLSRTTAAMLFLILIFAFATVAYAKFAGLILFSAIVVFGGVSLFYHSVKLRTIGMVAIILLSILNIAVNGIHFGIDFSGGTKIPIILDKSVDQQTMSKIIDTIKSRASVLGLTEVKVKAIGDNEISLELANTTEDQISTIEKSVSQQGVFLGIVDGKVALSGDDLYSQTIRLRVPGSTPGRDWEVFFTMTNDGARTFASTVKGKPRFPVYMFLDRPTDSIIVLSREKLLSSGQGAVSAVSTTAPATLGDYDTINAAKSALKLENNNIEMYFVENILQNTTNL
ncbi:hypothetical protein HZC07_02950, partial [Candidatus Micrarchaeota archaeon]|nr:hypothetical protein [Candidatus Micrarchaeota archaeon]